MYRKLLKKKILKVAQKCDQLQILEVDKVTVCIVDNKFKEMINEMTLRCKNFKQIVRNEKRE